jgi:hypothetical protein
LARAFQKHVIKTPLSSDKESAAFFSQGAKTYLVGVRQHHFFTNNHRPSQTSSFFPSTQEAP